MDGSSRSLALQVAIFACSTPRSLPEGLLTVFISQDGGTNWLQASDTLLVYRVNTSAAPAPSLAPYAATQGPGLSVWPPAMLAPLASSQRTPSTPLCILSAAFLVDGAVTTVTATLDRVETCSAWAKRV